VQFAPWSGERNTPEGAPPLITATNTALLGLVALGCTVRTIRPAREVSAGWVAVGFQVAPSSVLMNTPAPPAKVTSGAEVKPVPPLVIITLVTTPLVSTAVPAAPVPPPPLNTTVGATAKLAPPSVMVTPVTAPAAKVPVPLPKEGLK